MNKYLPMFFGPRERRFQYRELTARNEIRLLRIDTSVDGPPVFHLEHHLLDRCPRFAAVSYRWDNESYTTMELDGQRINVLTSIANLLKKLALLRMPLSSPRHFWIDSVCINQLGCLDLNNPETLCQTNNPELLHQIPLMKQIYTQAQHAIAWLDNPCSDGEADQIRHAVRQIKHETHWARLSAETRQGVEIICSKPIGSGYGLCRR
jgi:hypothetical protein